VCARSVDEQRADWLSGTRASLIRRVVADGADA
jgi:hypothetical protein